MIKWSYFYVVKLGAKKKKQSWMCDFSRPSLPELETFGCLYDLQTPIPDGFG